MGTSAPISLRTVLGDYPHTTALKNGGVRTDGVVLDIVPYSPTYAAFKPMVRELAFDVREMAIVTYLIAKAHGKKLMLLPAVMLGRYQHPSPSTTPSAASSRPATLPAGVSASARSPPRPGPGSAASWRTTTASISAASNG